MIGEINGVLIGDPPSVVGSAIALAVACLAVCLLLVAMSFKNEFNL